MPSDITLSLSSLSPFEIAKNRYYGGTHIRRAKDAVVSVVPKYKLGINDEYDDIFYKVRVLLRVAWKISVEQLKVIYNVSSWKELFLLKVVDHFETEDFPEDEDLFEYEDIFEDIERNPDFMASRIMNNRPKES